MGRGPGRWGLAGILAGAGVTHFVVPRVYDAVVPPWVPGPARFWTYASGVAELAAAGLLSVERTRRVGGWTAAALLVAVYPANLHMTWTALDALRERPGSRSRQAAVAATLARLPLQWPLVASAVSVAREARSLDAPGHG